MNTQNREKGTKMRHTIRLLAATALLAQAGLFAQPLAGNYTINRFLPPGGTNFNTLASAVQALTFNGVSAAVTFDIYDDDATSGLPTPWTESSTFAPLNVAWGTNNGVLVLALIATASPTNRITFQAAPGEQVQFNAAGQ